MTESEIDTLAEVATPARDRHARRREQTRARLVEAAMTLFAGQGVDNTRINEITDEADVGFGSFYNHFDRKEAIVEAVLAETVAAQAEAIEGVTRQLEDPAEVIAAAHRLFVRRARSDPDWGWLLVRLDVSHNVMLAALGSFARRDLRRAIKASRLRVSNDQVALVGAGGALLAVMRAVLDGRAAGRRHPPRRGRAAALRAHARGRGRSRPPATAPCGHVGGVGTTRSTGSWTCQHAPDAVL
jgi:AcrR family transcriptional regulator